MAERHPTPCIDCGAIRKSSASRCRVCAWKLRQKPNCKSCGRPRPVGKTCPACARASKREYKLRHPTRWKPAAAAYKNAKWIADAPKRYAAKIAKLEAGLPKAIRSDRRPETLRKEHRRIARRKWKRANPGLVNAHTAKRYAAKIQAIPTWANDFFIDEAYVLAQDRTEATGVKHVVDHEIPLQSPFVCGLHTHGNLRVITARENESKNNKRWPDMWVSFGELRKSVPRSPIRYSRKRRKVDLVRIAA